MTVRDQLIPIALAVGTVLACSIAWGRGGISAYDPIDPHTAYVTWSSGVTDRISTVVQAECGEILSSLQAQRWVPSGRAGLTVTGFTCRREDSRAPGSTCIVGYNCERR